MSLKPEVLDALLAAGATAEMIVAAVKADMLQDEARIEAKRANNAERQRRFKSKRRGAVTSDNAGNALPGVTPSPSLPPNEYISNPPTHPHPDNNTRARKGTRTPAKPEDVSEQVWDDFLNLRRVKRAPVTDGVVAGHRREAAKAGMTLEAALAECVNRGWQAFQAHFLTDRERPATGRPAANDPADFLEHLTAKRAGP